MKTTTVVYGMNGYSISLLLVEGPGALYAATIPEVVYWLGRYFAPFSAAAVAAAPARNAVLRAADDPLLNKATTINDVATGGFIVHFQVTDSSGPPGKPAEQYCVNMDEVAVLLGQIYAPPAG